LFDKNPIQVAGATKPDILKYLNPKISNRDYQLLIRFSDMLGNKYVQKYNIGKSGTSTGIIQKNDEIIKQTIIYK
jgi:hypothetical protein